MVWILILPDLYILLCINPGPLNNKKILNLGDVDKMNLPPGLDKALRQAGWNPFDQLIYCPYTFFIKAFDFSRV
jgi:hypothetical protein